ncbi:MAG TPA: glycosyltransferase family 4 protein [Spirochaetota bacterium]|nr:glycosyltransferase family 4 protein [Spirochaetota bacterium]
MDVDTGRPLKILIVNYEHPPLGGGGGVCTQNVSKALAKKGHTVHILTSGAKGLPAESVEEGVKVFRVPVLGRKDLATASNLSMFTFPMTSIPKGLLLCLKHRYDIINTHFYAPSGPTGLVLSLISRIPNVLYIHGADVYDPTRLDKTPAGRGLLSRLLRASAKLQNRFARAVACQSSNTRENIETYIKPSKQVTVIPLPFQRPEHPETSRKALKLDPKKYYLLSAGRVVKRKGYDHLIRALRSLHKNIQLLILGDGPELPALKELASSLGVDDRVRFLGYIASDEEKFRYYGACDLYVLSSLHEGMGIVVQEAMEFGMPVVATNHGGQVDLISDGVNGLLVPPGDPDALAGAIRRVHADRKLAKKFGSKNRELIERYYAPGIAGEYERLFRRVLAGE